MRLAPGPRKQVSFDTELSKTFFKNDLLLRQELTPCKVRQYDGPRSEMPPNLWWTMEANDKSRDVICVAHGMALLDRGGLQRDDTSLWTQRAHPLDSRCMETSSWDHSHWREQRTEERLCLANTRNMSSQIETYGQYTNSVGEDAKLSDISEFMKRRVNTECTRTPQPGSSSASAKPTRRR